MERKVDSSDAKRQRDLYVSHIKRGEVLREQGDLTGALAAYGAAFDSQSRIGDQLRAQGNLAGALEAYRAMLTIVDRQAKEHPDNAFLQSDIGICHSMLGGVYSAMGRDSEALEAFRCARAILTPIADQYPDLKLLKKELATLNKRIAWLLVKVEKVTIRQAIKDLGWMPKLYSTLVSAPSLLSILQAVLKEHRLTPAFQWIVDGYSQLTAVLAAWIEPWLAPVIAWLNTLFGWHIVLNPIWRPVFLLWVLPASAIARWVSRLVAFSSGPMVALAGSLVVVNAYVGALVLAICNAWIYDLSSSRTAFISKENLIGQIMALVAGTGVVFMAIGFRNRDSLDVRLGLFILSGFITAAMIVCADALVRLLGIAH
jgi:hypothetical protein